MRRSFFQRLFIVTLLLCKLVTGEFMYVAMAEGATVEQQGSSSSHVPPCHEHAPGLTHKVAARAAAVSNPPSAEHSELCKFGSCKCPCVHPPALATPTLPTRSQSQWHIAPTFYAAPSPQGSLATLFRPPI